MATSSFTCARASDSGKMGGDYQGPSVLFAVGKQLAAAASERKAHFSVVRYPENALTLFQEVLAFRGACI